MDLNGEVNGLYGEIAFDLVGNSGIKSKEPH
jgi:hypothetical protein